MDQEDQINDLNATKRHEAPFKAQDNTETFISQEKSRNIMKFAYEKKKEAAALSVRDRKKSFHVYLDSIFEYIKGYLLFEKEYSLEKMVNEWKSLDKYLMSLIIGLKESEREYKNIYEYVQFNIRFHYLFYDGYYAIKKEDSECKDVLRGFLSLKGILEKSMIDNFCVMRLEHLEKYVRNKLKIITDVK